MIKKLFAILSLAAVVVSCSTDEDAVETTPMRAISISPIMTKATDLAFEGGDAIGVSVVLDGSEDENFLDNEKFIYSGSTFEGDGVWYEDVSETSTLYAYYPYAEAGVPDSFTVSTDQSTHELFTASDLIWASQTGVTPSDSAIPMTFIHLLSRIVVDVDNKTEKAITSVAVEGVRPTVTFDAIEGSVVVESMQSAVDVTACLGTDNLYRAIIAPQAAAISICVTLEGGASKRQDYVYSHFTSGAEYKLSITIE